MVIISAHTGLRQMELLTLRWSQIDFKGKTLILDNQFSITKSKRVRAIPLNLTALQIFTKLEINKGNNDLIFSRNGYIFKQNFIGSIFKGYVIKAGLNPKLHWHSLRHTCASWLIQKGVPIFSVQTILGHADIQTTSIYTHIRNEDLSEALSRISNNN
jgi:integrase